VTTDRYPVLEEHTLPPVRRRLLLGGRRDPAEIPVQRPGSVLVFRVNDRYETFSGRHLNGAEEIVIEAISVSLVDIRPCDIQVTLPIPSKNAANDFMVQVTFRCQVTDPAMVVSHYMHDPSTALRIYLAQDSMLLALGQTLRIDDINQVREMVRARVTAYCTVRPPTLAGMQVTLADVGVATPRDLVLHAADIRDEERSQALAALRASGEHSEIDRLLRQINHSPQAMLALALHRGDLTAAEVADIAFARQAEERHALLTVLKLAAEQGYLDRIPVDVKALVARLGVGSDEPDGDEEVDAEQLSPEQDDVTG
jgi:hypothetical protein